MIAVFYVVVCALLIVFLAICVIRIRRENHVKHDDGGIDALLVARAAHSNATEYIPIALLLLLALEYNGGHIAFVHAGGLCLVIGRIIHANAILTDNLSRRVVGMAMTFSAIVGLSVVNLWYLPW